MSSDNLNLNKEQEGYEGKQGIQSIFKKGGLDVYSTN